MTAQLRLDLNTTFCLTNGSGHEIRLASERLRALVAILATSKDCRRPRKVLQDMLWPRSPEEQASGSLRTALSMLRRALDTQSALLGADRSYVWLTGIELARRREINGGFFEDAPHLGDQFEDWLSWERANHFSERPYAGGQVQPATRKPCVLLCQPRVLSDDPYSGFIIQSVCDQLVHSLRLHDLVDVFDLRDLATNQLPAFGEQAMPRPDYALQSELTKSGKEAQISLKILEPSSRRVIWSCSLNSEQGAGFLFSRPQVEEFANTAADALLVALIHQSETTAILRGGETQSLVGAVHHVLGMSVEGQRSARAFLQSYARAQDSSVAMALYAFSLANSIGEGDLVPGLADAAEEYCRRAIEIDPTNGLTLALTAHVYGYVLRRLELGYELAARARQVAPHLALAWDLSAMNAVYLGHNQDALRFSLNARRLGQFSPYKPLFDSSLTIAASVSGDHTLGLRAADAVLAQSPNFLALMRYQFGNLAAAGEIEKARTLLIRIRERDERFRPDEIAAPDYPFPSADARVLVQNAFKLVGWPSEGGRVRCSHVAGFWDRPSPQAGISL